MGAPVNSSPRKERLTWIVDTLGPMTRFEMLVGERTGYRDCRERATELLPKWWSTVEPSLAAEEARMLRMMFHERREVHDVAKTLGLNWKVLLKEYDALMARLEPTLPPELQLRERAAK
jgi:hypothetical protein